MIQAITEKNQKKALNLYADLLEMKEPPMRILFLIARQFNQLLQLKSLSAQGMEKGEMAKKAAEAETATTEEERLYKEAEIVKLQNEAASTAPVVPIIKKPKGGPSVRENFVGTVTDKVKFLKFVAQHIDDNPEFLDFFEVKQTKINNYIKMTKGLKALDGVEITKGVTLVTRSRK